MGGALASWLVRSGPGSGPGQGHLCCVLGQDTLLSRCLSPPRCINWYRRNARLASHPGGSINTPSRFMLRKLEISAGLMGLLARKQ